MDKILFPLLLEASVCSFIQRKGSPIPSTPGFAQSDGLTSFLLSCSDFVLFSDCQGQATPPRLDEKLSP